ncbi:hypothetical protein BD410DRAFT_688437, partial [Rickenella mellea]
QGISTVMEKWKPHFKLLQNGILSREADIGIPGICRGAGCEKAALYRCLECTQGLPYCDSCIVTAHRHLPLHWVDKWDCGYFNRVEVSTLGLIVHLGHRGEPCPNIPTGANFSPSNMATLHVNGMHSLKIHWCHCVDPSQLIHAGFFPATPETPESAFTIQLLEEFHLHALTSKKSAYDFVRALYRLGNNAFPDDAKERSREFNVATRIWSYLVMEKRSGQAHEMDSLLPHRQPGSLVVHCPACPEPGFNMPEGWKDTPPNLAYIHQIQLGADGNFRLQKKTKQDDPNDRSLCPGRSYFADEDVFNDYLASVGDENAPVTCTNLKAGNMQRATKFKNCDVTGVGAIMCIRHGLFRRGAIVDFQKGERFSHIDYALSAALRG